MPILAMTKRSRVRATRLRGGRRGAFALVDVMVGLALLTLIAASAIWSLTQMNRFAVSDRLATCAETIAQNQVDAFLMAGPFSVQLSLIPAELAIGTTTIANVPIYTDPSNGVVVVTGTL